MNLRGKEKDIEEIRLGHESESLSIGWIMTLGEERLKKFGPMELGKMAFEDGMYAGIKWLASYLNEYGISVELYDKVIKPKPKDDWYSGIIRIKNQSEETQNEEQKEESEGNFITEEKFKELVYNAIENRQPGIRKGQAAFNYVDEQFYVARYVQLVKHIDCFYDDSVIDEFIHEAYIKHLSDTDRFSYGS